MGTVLCVTAEVVRRVAILSQPYIPGSAAKFLDQLGVPPEERGFEALDSERALKPGTEIATPQPVFPRYLEDKTRAAQ
jgi:methionyl-tRNA synthetase